MKGAENEETYYIRTKWKDPSDEFMKRFAASKPAVKKMSAGKSLIDKSKARQIFLDDIRWKESAEVNVGAHYYFTGIVHFYSYVVARQKGSWEVVKEQR